MCVQPKEKLMPEAWIKRVINSNVWIFHAAFVSEWVNCLVADDVDAMGVMCMGGEL